MRRERYEPMEYANAELMEDLNNFCIALKIWLYPEEMGDKLEDFKSRHPKPGIDDLDQLQARIHLELMKDAKPLRKY